MKKERKSKRTTSQFVFAFGLNNLVTRGRKFKDSDFNLRSIFMNGVYIQL